MPVVIIGREHIALEGKRVGSAQEIDQLGKLHKIDDLFEALSARRNAWKAAHEGEAFPGAASLVVAPGTSGRAFASAYQTIAFAGFPHIHVAVGGQYYATEAQIPGPPCGLPKNPCPPTPPLPALHVQAEEQLWRLRLPRDGGLLDDRGEGARATVERFRAAASGIVSASKVGRIVLHVAPDVSFARLAPFLVEVVNLSRTGGSPSGVTISASGIDVVPATAHADAPIVSQRLPPEHIQQVVRANFAGLRNCYERALARDPRVMGKASTRFVIARDGTVAEARTELTGNLPPDMSRCIEAAFRSFKFDVPKGGIVTVTYPIMFSPSQ